MYLDKLYTRLYSDGNIDGLNQLMTEIRVFAKSDYKGLTESQAKELKAMRDKLAKKLKDKKSQGKADEHYQKNVKSAANLAKNSVKGYNGVTTSGLKKDVDKLIDRM